MPKTHTVIHPSVLTKLEAEAEIGPWALRLIPTQRGEYNDHTKLLCGMIPTQAPRLNLHAAEPIDALVHAAFGNIPSLERRRDKDRQVYFKPLS